jgi:DNA-binding transcriptional LysR family regulator
MMAEATRRIQRQAPGVAIEIVPPDDDPSELLERGEIDFLAMPAPCLSDLHPSETLLEDGYVCVVWKGNLLVDDTLSLEQYLSLGHVERRFGKSRAPSILDHFWISRGHKRRLEVIVPTFNLVPQFIVGTTRIATVHTRLAKIYAQHLPVRLVPPPIELPTLREAIQWHRYLNQDPGTMWMRRVLREAVDHADPSPRARRPLPAFGSAMPTPKGDLITTSS